MAPYEGHGAGSTDRNVDDNVSELHMAVQAGKTNAVRKLLERGAVVSSRDGAGRTPLLWAITMGLDDIAKVLLVNTRRQSLCVGDRHGKTPLHYAAAVGNAELCRILLDRGAPLDARDAFQRSPLHEAGATVGSAVVELLVGRGANVGATDTSGRLPRDVALEVRSQQSARALGATEEELLHGAEGRCRSQVPREAAGAEPSCTTSVAAAEACSIAVGRGPSALEELLGAWKSAEVKTKEERDSVRNPRKAEARSKLESALAAWKDSAAAHVLHEAASTEVSPLAEVGAVGNPVDRADRAGCEEKPHGSRAAISCSPGGKKQKVTQLAQKEVGTALGGSHLGGSSVVSGHQADARDRATWASVQDLLLIGLGRLELPRQASGEVPPANTAGRPRSHGLRRTASSPEDASHCTEWDAATWLGGSSACDLQREVLAKEARVSELQRARPPAPRWSRLPPMAALAVAAN